jgi:hypothetical protein
VIRDLKPYICVFEDCQVPDKLFGAFREWIAHMTKEHMPLEWHCAAPAHSPKTCHSEKEFHIHMQSLHSNEFSGSQLPMLARRSMRPAFGIFAMCPFCNFVSQTENLSSDEAQENLQKHVAEHLQSLALMSLPLLNNEETTGFTSSEHSLNKNIDSRSVQSNVSRSLLFQDDEILHDNIESLSATPGGPLESWEPDIDDYTSVNEETWDFMSRETDESILEDAKLLDFGQNAKKQEATRKLDLVQPLPLEKGKAKELSILDNPVSTTEAGSATIVSTATSTESVHVTRKINDYVILEELGQ